MSFYENKYQVVDGIPQLDFKSQHLPHRSMDYYEISYRKQQLWFNNRMNRMDSLNREMNMKSNIESKLKNRLA